MAEEEGFEEPLNEVLSRARPSWSVKELQTATKKLAQVGITTTSELVSSLSATEVSERLNERLKNAGLKAFSGETMGSFRKCMNLENVSLPKDKLASPKAQILDLREENARTQVTNAAADQVRNSTFANFRKPVAPAKAKGQEIDSIPDLESLLMDLDSKTDVEVEKRCSAKGVVINDLEDPDRAEELIDRIERLDRMTASKLQQEYEQRGFAADEYMSRQELGPKVKDALYWEALNLRALQEVCMKQGLDLDMSESRDELFKFLAESSWEELGIPVGRFTQVSDARRAYEEIRNLESSSKVELAVKCKEFGFPADSKEEDMLVRLKMVMIWKELPVEELRKECKVFKVAPDGDTASDEKEIEKRKLVQGLVIALQGNRYDIFKIPADRLDPKEAEEILKEVEHLQVTGLLSLKRAYHKWGVKWNVRFERQVLVDRLKDVLVWKSLPMTDLVRLCHEQMVIANGSRHAIAARLLERRDRKLLWEEQGIPVMQLKYKDAAALVEQFQYIDGMRTDELKEWYQGTGLPEEKGMDRKELIFLLKKVTAWQAQPMNALESECKKVNFSVEDDKRPGGDKEKMIDALFFNEAMELWDKKGFCAKQIGSVEVVSQAVAQNEGFQAMDDEELKNTYKEVGLPEGVDDREQILKTLKTVLVWELLPMTALESEAAKRKIRVESGRKCKDDAEKKGELVQLMIYDLFKELYENKGIPVDRLGSEAVGTLASQYDRFETMTEEELRSAHEEMVPLHSSSLNRRQLIARMQDLTLWAALPTEELWKECQQKGIPMGGFSIEDVKENKDEIRGQLQDRLILMARAMEAEDPDFKTRAAMPPVATANGKLKPSEMPRVWKIIEDLRDPLMSERVCSVIHKDLPRDILLPAEATSWEPLVSAIYVLSGGKVDVGKERANLRPLPKFDGSEDKPLITVTCPTTSERRGHFHPLLYECFKTQDYEPKELVVVDTGAKPSPFFQDVAREDYRVVYRHYPIEDSIEGPRGKSQKLAWSLGLKRNIACYISRGSMIAHFDDDDLYASGYLTWMGGKLHEAAQSSGRSTTELSRAAAKLSEWHMLDMTDFALGYLDVQVDKNVPLRERRGYLYGWGFSYIFTRAAWEAAPFPDVEFAEDSGFMEGLMARNIPVLLLQPPDARNGAGLVAHSYHSGSTSGGELQDFKKSGNRVTTTPEVFRTLMPMVRQVASRSTRLTTGIPRTVWVPPAIGAGGMRKLGKGIVGAPEKPKPGWQQVGGLRTTPQQRQPGQEMQKMQTMQHMQQMQRLQQSQQRKPEMKPMQTGLNRGSSTLASDPRMERLD